MVEKSYSAQFVWMGVLPVVLQLKAHIFCYVDFEWFEQWSRILAKRDDKQRQSNQRKEPYKVHHQM